MAMATATAIPTGQPHYGYGYGHYGYKPRYFGYPRYVHRHYGWRGGRGYY